MGLIFVPGSSLSWPRQPACPAQAASGRVMELEVPCLIAWVGRWVGRKEENRLRPGKYPPRKLFWKGRRQRDRSAWCRCIQCPAPLSPSPRRPAAGRKYIRPSFVASIFSHCTRGSSTCTRRKKQAFAIEAAACQACPPTSQVRGDLSRLQY